MARVASATTSDERRKLSQRFNELLSNLRVEDEYVRAARAENERQVLASLFGFERAPLRLPPSFTPISQNATDLIVACEVTSAKKYAKSYQRPTWPNGQSGVTIGVGYDVGYVSKENLGQDWESYIDSSVISALAVACGVTGEPAKQLTSSLQAITIPWDVAFRQFLKEVQPRYVSETERALPNTTLLTSDSLGSLVSLVYNRGASFNISSEKDTTGRYREMRNIRSWMMSKEFSKIPDEIRAMKRLWKDKPKLVGLVERRELEATLFEIGLKAHSKPA
jgi:GH24 family phage-related lysozyme (muramidase)